MLDLILPICCLICSTPTTTQHRLCEACKQQLPWITNHCQICGLPQVESGICGQCLANRPRFTSCRALFRYQEPIDKLITQLKFNNQLHIAKLFASLLVETFDTSKPTPELLIPVPLHRKRQRQRGFNQALEIARPVSKALQIPIDIHSCIRVKSTQAQSELPAKKRRYNIKNAFQICHDIGAKHVAIIDDVVTTGSTVNELSKNLKQRGVKCIEIWCLARAEFN